MAITDTIQESTQVFPTELLTARQVTLPLHLYQPGDSSLITACSTHQHRNKLRLQRRKQLATQSQTLQTTCKSRKGIVVVLCTHSFLLIQTVNSMKQLFTVFQNDFAQNQLVRALMTDLLREVSFSMDRVAMNRIPQYPMQTVLDFATGRPTKTVPAHLADSLGAAILLHVDPEQKEVAVLLNLPSSEPDNSSRPKDKVNVRWWQGNTHTKIHTSDVVVYHYSNPQLYLAPHLSRCILTKDIHYLGSNKPSLRNHTEGMGRLQPMTRDTRCPAEAKPCTQVIRTQAEIVGDRLLVHTPTHAATLTYNQHNTATHVSLPNPTLQALSQLPVLTSSPIAQAWTAADTALCLSMATEYALSLGLASILAKGIKGMQESMDKCLSALPQGFKRRHRRGSVKSKKMPSLIEMDREPVGTTCCLTILIHVPSDVMTVQRGPHGNFVGRRGSGGGGMWRGGRGLAEPATGESVRGRAVSERAECKSRTPVSRSSNWRGDRIKRQEKQERGRERGTAVRPIPDR
ncbi:hypothetical protein DPX16_22804 [Anabarilius grahami]|uniref:Uncharacterized protein n=1 Tax=Anabarilius grahami TaxID=495550 RepID=A0A3N0ZBH2_ANAGA|nr:hypothetical protein DPX16_22804 [Anabarilius grahami]